MSRVELDCRAYHHRKHWQESVLPRLYQFARMVYRFRDDDMLRFRYLVASPVGDDGAIVKETTRSPLYVSPRLFVCAICDRFFFLVRLCSCGRVFSTWFSARRGLDKFFFVACNFVFSGRALLIEVICPELQSSPRPLLGKSAPHAFTCFGVSCFSCSLIHNTSRRQDLPLSCCSICSLSVHSFVLSRDQPASVCAHREPQTRVWAALHACRDQWYTPSPSPFLLILTTNSTETLSLR